MGTKAKAIVTLQARKLDELLVAIEADADPARRVRRIVEVIEKLIAHLAVKKNILYPMIGDAHASVLVGSWMGTAAVHRGLLRLARASRHDELCTLRAKELRASLAEHSRQDERVLEALEDTLAPPEYDRLGRQAERFHDACLRARRDATLPRAAAS